MPTNSWRDPGAYCSGSVLEADNYFNLTQPIPVKDVLPSENSKLTNCTRMKTDINLCSEKQNIN